MAANAKYTITSDPNYHLQSVVHSFGIDHTTEKDLKSFYKNVSSYSYIDTGLLPVFGSGLLSLRGAGGHYQIAYQHAPNKYLVNWGAYEGDANAKAYFLAQPYRIVIIDIVDKSIYGARHFYSPYPITHMDAQLYHANLPNLNCKGYTNNVGVGWICLYHNTSSSNIEDFSELVRIGLERTSGVEPYNDQNMSLTDGVRFYKDYYNEDPNYQFLWNPQLWQSKTEEEGIAWTLNPELWAPILVSSMDDQSCHYYNGIPFTLHHALFGNYKAYYYDDNVPKLVNIIAREDLHLSSSTVYNIFTKAHNNTDSYDSSTEPIVTEQMTLYSFNHKDIDNDEDEDEDNYFICDSCEDSHSVDEAIHTLDGYIVCSNCTSDIYFVAHQGDYYFSSDDLIFDQQTENYYNIEYLKENIHYFTCNECKTIDFDHNSIFGYSPEETYIYPFLGSHAFFSLENMGSVIHISSTSPNYWKSKVDQMYYCANCIEHQNSLSSFVIENHRCSSCDCYIPNLPNDLNSIIYPGIFIQETPKNLVISPDSVSSYKDLDLYDKYSFYYHHFQDDWFNYCPRCRPSLIKKFYESQIPSFVSKIIEDSFSEIDYLLEFSSLFLSYHQLNKNSQEKFVSLINNNL